MMSNAIKLNSHEQLTRSFSFYLRGRPNHKQSKEPNELMKTRNTIFTPILLALGLLALYPEAQAVRPAPDGGYPGFNTAEGTDALKNLTTGVGNAAVGWHSLFSNTDGSYNTALGAGALLLNIGNQGTSEGTQNTAVGTGALLFNTTGLQHSQWSVHPL